jgi:hypothetical protein
MESRTKEAVPSVAEEFAGAELGNQLRTRRAMRIAEACSNSPASSFPDVAGDTAELEGLYRFFGNGEVDQKKLVEAHAEKTCERAARAGLIVCAHDTTEFGFSTDVPRRGLAKLRTNTQGFLAHMAIAVSATGTREMLGALALNAWVRKRRRSKRGSARERYESRESRRWEEQVDEVEALVAGRAAVIHVMDREADAFPLLSRMVDQKRRFVVRLTHDRNIELKGVDTTLREAVRRSKTKIRVTVPLSKRKASKSPNSAATHNAREARVAELAFSATKLTFPRPANCPAYWAEGVKEIEVNVVRVFEPNSPEGDQAVEWLLSTTEPVDTAEQVQAVVDFYRARWVIEEFFKALKTGCAYEQRQLESYPSLLCALAIFLPIAWRLVALRDLASRAPDAPATGILTPVQLQVLRAKSRKKLGKQPTAAEALLAVAALGGHLKRNGAPGWLVTWRGMRKLNLMVEGWLACKGSGT